MDTDPLVQPYSGAISHQQPVIATTCPAAAHDPIGSGRAAAAQIAAGHQSESASADASPKDSSTDASMAASSSDGSTKPVPTGFDRTIHVFTREAVAAAEASSRYSLCLIFLKLAAVCYSKTPDLCSLYRMYMLNAKTHALSKAISKSISHLYGPTAVHIIALSFDKLLFACCRSNTELPPEFYDFTPDDYHKVMSGWAKQNSKAAGLMKTQKLREQDERRRAEQFGPIPVRLHFPDGSIVQANFKALDTLASLQKLVQQCMLPNLPQWYLYVTPPKQALKDLSLTFYKAGLLPAANVLVGMDSKHDGLFLKPEVAALQAVPPPRTVARQSNGAETSGTSKGNVGSSVQFLPSSKATGEKKVPKWMKLGK